MMVCQNGRAGSTGELFDELGSEDEEAVVLSAIYQELPDGGGHPPFVLRHAALIVGPPSLADCNWPQWHRDHSGRCEPHVEEAASTPVEFRFDGPGFVAGRAVVDVTAARQWLLDCVDSGVAPAIGPLPAAQAPLTPPDALLHIFPRLYTPVARLATQAGRPSRGFFFAATLPELSNLQADVGEEALVREGPPKSSGHLDQKWTVNESGTTRKRGLDDLGLTPEVAEAAARAERPEEAAAPALDFMVPAQWTVNGIDVMSGCSQLLGIAVPNPMFRSMKPAAAGLLVARLERRAWFNDVAGDGQFVNYLLQVGLEPDRVDVADLEVTLEEWASDELANARRLDLGDLDVGERAGLLQVTVALPTLGRGLAHAALLHDRDGARLDMTQRSKLLQQVRVTVQIDAEGEVADQSFTVGKKLNVEVFERLERLRTLEDAYRDLLQAGLAARIVTVPTRAVSLVNESLQLARGELLVMDPYFGGDLRDWDVLQGLSVAVRVLTGSKGKAAPGCLPRVKVRRHKPGQGAPPFHDRLYLWEGGGLSVGTSPSGLGKRDTRIDRLRAWESDGWRALFEAYWRGGAFADA